MKDTVNHRIEFANRVHEIVAILLDRQQLIEQSKSKDILAIIQDKYSINQRMAQHYLTAAKEEISLLGKEKIKEAYIKAMCDRELLFRKAKDTNDLRLALEVIRDRDKIAGLYVENYKFEEGTLPDLENISTDELKEMLNSERTSA